MNCVYIAVLSAIAQNMNFAGNMLAGSGVFAVIYSSVTVWCAVLSRLILQRVMTTYQWCAVFTVMLLGGLAFGNFLHAAAFFHLLAHIGATSSGVFKAVQAVAVFGLSHVMYCSRDASQCLNTTK